MKIFSAAQIKAWDDFTIHHAPISSIDLMEKAALAITEYLLQHYSQERFLIFCGSGNNGGDGLAVARLLLEKKIEAEVILLQDRDLAQNTQVNYQRWLDAGGKATVVDSLEEIESLDWPSFKSLYTVFMDALLGTGVNRPVEGNYASLITHINELHAQVLSIDIPSGLPADQTLIAHGAAVQAKETITLQVPKRSFFYTSNYDYTGSWYVATIGLSETYEKQTSSSVFYTLLDDIKELYKPRSPIAHKGNFGKALLMTGSYGMMGAAVMTAKACLRSGVGLLKVYTPACGLTVLQTAVPEAMVLTDPSEKEFTTVPDLTGYQAIGLGPGWHESDLALSLLKQLLKQASVPLVIDAGALNVLSKDQGLLAAIPKGSILTPHKKEFDRLAGKELSQTQQEEQALAWAQQYQIQFILKGKNSAVVLSDGTIHYNSTGNPGMAKGGSGDCLTGILVGLLAQGYSSADAARFGAFLQGYAADRAAEECSEEAMLATDIIDNLGELFKELNKARS